MIVLAGGGSYLALFHKNNRDKHNVIPLAVPGCTVNVATASPLQVPSNYVGVRGNPFGLQATSDGKFVFAISATTLDVLARGPGLALIPQSSYTIATAQAAANGGAQRCAESGTENRPPARVRVKWWSKSPPARE